MPDEETRVRVFDPADLRISRLVKDPTYTAIHSKWRDRQQHGRLTYESMLKHGAVAGPMGALNAFLKSSKPLFKPTQRSPTDHQKRLADFANDMILRLASTGSPVDGWERVIDWFGMGLTYGFSLAELTTTRAVWGGKTRIVPDRFVPIPQASLDLGFIPREEFGEGVLSGVDPRYRCFSVSPDGRVTAVHQFFRDNQNREGQITWDGADLNRIIHFAHNSADGNPYGKSALWTAYYHWASLYSIEQLEEVFLDASFPWLGISYKTQDGRPSPDLHQEVVNLIANQDPAIRAMVIPDATFSSVSATNPNFSTHVEKKKSELRRYITWSVLVPLSTYSETEYSNNSDTRELMAVFFKHVLPSYQKEISNVMTWQFAKRLIDTNWGPQPVENYPALTFQNVTANDLRVSQEILKMAFPYIDSDRLGEFLQTFIVGFESDWIPESHDTSVSMSRQPPAANPADPGAGGKEPGSPDNRTDGQTSNPSNTLDTAA